MKKKKRTPLIKKETNTKVTKVTSKPSIDKSFWSKAWKYIVGLSVIVTLYLAYEPIKDSFLTPREQLEKEKFYQGDLKPPKFIIANGPIKYSLSETPLIFKDLPLNDTLPRIKGIYIENFKKRDSIMVWFDNYCFICPTKDFYKGINFFNPYFASCTNSNLIIGAKDDRLYVSAEFKDLQTEETIGIIEFNHWKLYKSNVFDFENDDERLEVKDKQNEIVFSIRYANVYIKRMKFYCPTVFISGYFISPSSVLVVPNVIETNTQPTICFSKSDTNWKKNAQIEIEKIRSIFKPPFPVFP